MAQKTIPASLLPIALPEDSDAIVAVEGGSFVKLDVGGVFAQIAAATTSAAEALASAQAAQAAADLLANATNQSHFFVVTDGAGQDTFDLVNDPVLASVCKVHVRIAGFTTTLSHANNEFALVASGTAPEGKAIQLLDADENPQAVPMGAQVLIETTVPTIISVAETDADIVSDVTGRPLSESYAPIFTRAQFEAATILAPVVKFLVDGLFFERDPAGDALTSANGITCSPFGEASVRHWGAVLDDVTVDTLPIQRAINWMSQNGGGELIIDANCVVGPSVEPDLFYTSSFLDVDREAAADMSCLVCRDQVTLVLRNGATIRSNSTFHNVITMADMWTSGGLRGENTYGTLDGGWLNTGGEGVAHGCIERVTELLRDIGNVWYEKMIFKQAGGYGAARQYANPGGGMRDCISMDTGADGFDLKSRYDLADVDIVARYSDITAIRFGKRLAGSSGADIRGLSLIDNFSAREFAFEGNGNTGLRLSSGINAGLEHRPSSKNSQVANVYIDSGDPSVAGTIGIHGLSSEGSNVAMGTIRNCQDAVRMSTAASGLGDTSERMNLSMLDIEGCRNIGIDVRGANISIDGCNVSGTVDKFSEARANLAIGQTAIALPRQHLQATMQVYKNDVLLTLTTDYTVTAASGEVTAISLVVATIANDIIRVVTPVATAYSVERVGCTLVGCNAFDATVPLSRTVEVDVIGGNLRPAYGAWTPVVADASTGGNVASGVDLTGHWRRTGQWVLVTFNLTDINTTGLTGGNDLFIRGLPFPSAALSGVQRFIGPIKTNSTGTGLGAMIVELKDADAYLRIYGHETDGTGRYVRVSDMTDDAGDIVFNLEYLTDAA